MILIAKKITRHKQGSRKVATANLKTKQTNENKTKVNKKSKSTTQAKATTREQILGFPISKMHSMFRQPSEIQRQVESRIKLLNISRKPFIFSRDYFNIPASSSLFLSSKSSSSSSSQQQHTKGYHLVSTPQYHSRSKTLLYRLIVQTFLALFLITKCCDAAKQDGKYKCIGCNIS